MCVVSRHAVLRLIVVATSSGIEVYVLPFYYLDFFSFSFLGVLYLLNLDVGIPIIYADYAYEASI